MTENIKPLVADKEAEGLRVDKYILKNCPDITFGFIQKMCRKGQVRLNGKRIKGTERLIEGDEVRLSPAFYPKEGESPKTAIDSIEYFLSSQDRKLIENSIIYEDDDIMVINKPEGVPVQAGSGHTRSIDRMMFAMYPENTPRLAHRLDRATTGCLVLGKKRQVIAKITEGFKEKNWQKTYLALAVGDLQDPEGEIDFQLEKGMNAGSDMERMQIKESGGLTAYTKYKRIARAGKMHLLEVEPETGRTHQIRAHLNAIGVPILGDDKYGGGDAKQALGKKVKKLFLHAWKIEFTHPTTEVRMQFKAELPKYFSNMLADLKITIE